MLRAGGEDAEARGALDELCASYWPPVYALYRREGLDVEAARDLTQSLFAELLARGDVARASPEKGRFRAYLRTCARNLLANHRDAERAQKRGGGRAPLSLDVDGEEARLLREPIDALDAAAVFERRWAQAVIESALTRLERDEARAGREAQFFALRPTLDGDANAKPYAALAEDLGTSEGALKVAVHRLRARFKDALLVEVRETLPDGDEPGAELRELLAAFGPRRSA